MHVDEDRPTREQLDASWDETFERLRTFIAARVGDDDVAADIAQDVLVRSIAAGALRSCRQPDGLALPLGSQRRHRPLPHPPRPRSARPAPPICGQSRSRSTTGPTTPPVTSPAACDHSLAQLPEIYRDALDRVDLAGQSHHDAAVELGISTSGMKSRVQRARRQLKDLLTDCCAVQVDRLGAVSSYQPNAGPCGCPGRD